MSKKNSTSSNIWLRLGVAAVGFIGGLLLAKKCDEQEEEKNKIKAV